MLFSYVLLVGTIIFILGGIPIYFIEKKLYKYEIKKKSNNSVSLSEKIMKKKRLRIYKEGISVGEIEKLEKRLAQLNTIYKYNLNILILICLYVMLQQYI